MPDFDTRKHSHAPAHAPTPTHIHSQRNTPASPMFPNIEQASSRIPKVMISLEKQDTRFHLSSLKPLPLQSITVMSTYPASNMKAVPLNNMPCLHLNA